MMVTKGLSLENDDCLLAVASNRTDPTYETLEDLRTANPAAESWFNKWLQRASLVLSKALYKQVFDTVLYDNPSEVVNVQAQLHPTSDAVVPNVRPSKATKQRTSSGQANA